MAYYTLGALLFSLWHKIALITYDNVQKHTLYTNGALLWTRWKNRW